MKTTTTAARHQGFSITEMVIVVAVIGILSAMAISKYSGFNEASREVFARELLERLNTAVHQFNDGNYQLELSTTTDGSDASWVIQTLQYRKPMNPAVGSPYLANNWTPVISDNTEDYRIVWAGKLFKLVYPGTFGAGVKVDFDGASLSTPFNFPSDFTMAGR